MRVYNYTCCRSRLLCLQWRPSVKAATRTGTYGSLTSMTGGTHRCDVSAPDGSQQQYPQVRHQTSLTLHSRRPVTGSAGVESFSWDESNASARRNVARQAVTACPRVVGARRLLTFENHQRSSAVPHDWRVPVAVMALAVRLCRVRLHHTDVCSQPHRAAPACHPKACSWLLSERGGPQLRLVGKQPRMTTMLCFAHCD